MLDAPTVNISRMLRWNTLRRADHEALVDGERRLTYRELDQLVDAYAHALAASGVEPGDVVGVLARNGVAYVVEIMAISRIGAILVPFNFRLAARELATLCERAGVAYVMTEAEFLDKGAAMMADGGVRHSFLHDDVVSPLPTGWSAINELIAGAEASPYPDAEVGLEDVQRILFTSGTTSLPKGVMHTYANVLFNQLGQILELELSVRDRILISAPLFHVSGLEAPGHHVLAVGATMVMTPSYAGRDVIDICEKERITGIVLAAQILYEILDLPDLAQRDLSSLRYAIFGGVPPAVRRRFGDTFPGVRMIDTFGMTELTNGAAYLDQAHEWSKLGAMGSPFPYMDLRVVDRDGVDAPFDTVGEIWARSPKVSSGYWRDPEATAASWRDGWFRTGDMASRDGDGYFWFASREKDMIRSGGENVGSAEIEKVLAEHDDVAEVAVIGIPDPKWEEVPKAYVVLREGASVTAEQLTIHCRERLASFKVPKAFEFREVLPRNDSGKVLKRELRAESSS